MGWINIRDGVCVCKSCFCIWIFYLIRVLLNLRQSSDLVFTIYFIGLKWAEKMLDKLVDSVDDNWIQYMIDMR